MAQGNAMTSGSGPSSDLETLCGTPRLEARLVDHCGWFCHYLAKKETLLSLPASSEVERLYQLLAGVGLGRLSALHHRKFQMLASVTFGPGPQTSNMQHSGSLSASTGQNATCREARHFVQFFSWNRILRLLSRLSFKWLHRIASKKDEEPLIGLFVLKHWSPARKPLS